MPVLNPTSIAIIGAGAVGGYYGARLAEAGHDVTFLMRRDYNAVKSNGLMINSPDDDLYISKPQIVTHSKDIGPVDWVICALKATTIDAVFELLSPCVHESTNILVLMNGLGLEEFFASLFKEQEIFGGLAFTCINRGEPGIINHLDYGPITIGHFGNDEDLLKHATNLWQTSKVEVASSPSLLQARWEKLCWNIPFNGISVVEGGITTDLILSNPGLTEAAGSLMDEVIAIGNADLKAHEESGRIDNYQMKNRMFDLTKTMGAYQPSTMIDFIHGREMEIDAIFSEPIRRASQLGVQAPHISSLRSSMQGLQIDAERS
ncbi:MAG: 2-dehydropantoate 2-reductase [SAR202 cluster bacterium]|nr:2-dehydropantoate 2-reductase [SAR202 cluster bacterium]|tara:strand:- start:2550 stop:3506 length:957 start_codon:yes stop_codon:yes gene_type:complete